MSKTIDERVVSMQFDNKHFESNVQTSMSTLDKLKQKLRLDGATKGLENVNSAAKNVDMNSIGSGVETVRAKFSALQVMGVTALANITTAAVNAGAKIVKALAIDPVMDGFQEYEMTLNAVQTTMAGTGLTAKEVEKELKKLDEYADKTVYSTADMLNNLPKFTNAGVELKDATKAMIGIANATALAGGDAGKASIAFYNLGQAIGTGYLTRMDYNSINNAGIATMEWKNQMVDAAIAAGTLKKAGEDAYEAGGKTFTLQQLFIDGLQHQWATTDVMTKVFGDYGDAQTKIGDKAWKAATDVKTFTMMMDSLKATAGTGWKDTWQIIFGDLDQAKVFWTGLTNAISGVITGAADIRNKILEVAMGSPLGKMAESIKDITKTAKSATQPLKDYADVVDRIIRGDFGNQGDKGDKDYRKKLVEAEGYDYAKAQNLVNEKLGSSVRLTEKATEAQKENNKTRTATLDQLAEMSTKQLKTLGYTDEQIKSIKTLSKYADEADVPLSKFVKNMDDMTGREMLIESFKNAGKGLSSVFQTMKDAFLDIFPVSAESIGLKIYSVLTKIYEFSKTFDLSKDNEKNKETIDKLTRSFKGLFALLQTSMTILGGPLKLIFNIVGQLLDAFGLSFLDVTAYVGDALVAFNDWINKSLDFTDIFKKMVPWIQNAAKTIKELWIAFKDSEFVKTGKNIIQGLLNGLGDGLSNLWDKVTEIGKVLLQKLKDVLGIHSPSTEGHSIGTDFLQGMYNGFVEGCKMLWELVKSIGYTIINIIKELDFGKVAGAVIGTGIGVAIFKVLKIFENVTGPMKSLRDLLDDVSDVIQGLKKPLQKVVKAKAFEIQSQAILNIAKALGILVLAVIALTFIDHDKMWTALLAMVTMVGMLLLLTKAADQMDFKDSAQFAGLTGAIMVISVALAIIATAIKKLKFLNSDNVGPILLAMLGMVGMLALILFAFSKLSASGLNTDLEGAAAVLLKASAAILLMAVVMRMVAKIGGKDLTKGLVAITVLSAILVGLMAATKLFSKDATKIGSTLMGVAGAIAIMAGVVMLLGQLKPEKMAVGLLAITALSLIIVGLMAATRLFAKDAGNIGATLMGVAGAIAILGLTVALLSYVNPAKLAVGITAVGLLAGLVVGLMAATKAIAGGGYTKLALSLMMVSVAVAILGATAALLSFIDISALAKGIFAVGLVSALVVALMYATKGVEDCKNNLIVMTVAIGIMALAITLLSRLDPAGVAIGTLAISAVMGMFALMIYASKSAKDAMGTLIVMTVAMTLMATALIVLAHMPVENTLAAAGALSLTILAMAGVLLILSSISSITAQALVGILALTLMAVPMLAFVGVLYLMQGIENATTNVVLLVSLAVVCTALLYLLIPIGALWMPALIGIAGLTLMAVPLLAFVGVLYLMDGVQNATTNVELLLTLITTLAGVLAVIAPLAPLAIIGVTAMTMLTHLMVIIGAMAVAIGALMEKFPALQSFLDTGIPVMIQLAGGIGEMIGAFIGGLATQIASTLPAIGLALSQFMLGATPFIAGVKMVDKTVLAGVAILAAAVIALTAADFMAGISSFLQGGSSFATLGLELSAFMLNAMPFIMMTRQLDPALMAGVKTLAEAILTLTAANLLDSITSFFTGESSLDKFSTELPKLGEGIRGFIDKVGDVTSEEVAIAARAAKIIKTLASAAAEIPNTGGLLGSLVGENDMGPWASQLPKVATGIRGFITNLTTDAEFGSKEVKLAENAAEVIKTLAAAASEIPNIGGALAWLVGDNDLGTFAKELPNVGAGIRGFITALTSSGSGDSTSFGEKEVEIANRAAEIVKTLASASNEIPNAGGALAWLVGDNELSTFAKEFPNVGEGIRGFADKIGEFSSANYASVVAATDALRVIADIGGGDFDIGNIDDFGPKMGQLAVAVADFANDVSSVTATSISTAAEKILAVKDIIASTKGVDTKSAAAFTKALEAVGTDAIKKFIEATSGDKAIESVTASGSEMLMAFKSGVESVKTRVTLYMQTVASSVVSALKSKNDKGLTLVARFENVGVDAVTGFANGLKNKDAKKLVTDAASSLGKAALDAAKEALDENSPSKEMYKVGDFAGIGFVNALDRYAAKAFVSGSNMGESARNGLSKAVAKVTDIINNDIDAQPTIRPVLDLSDVRAGASAIGGMFGSRTISVDTSTVNSIAASMAGYQNGGNSDVVSAIRGLRKDISNMPRNTYSVGSVSYDDGSNIADAVESLVRAARIERRT